MKMFMLPLLTSLLATSAFASGKSLAHRHSSQPQSNVYVDATGVPSATVDLLQAALQVNGGGKAVQCFDLGGSEERCGYGYDHPAFHEDGLECYTKNYRAGSFYDCSRSVAGDPLYRAQLRKDGQLKYNNFWAPTSNHSERYR